MNRKKKKEKPLTDLSRKKENTSTIRNRREITSDTSDRNGKAHKNCVAWKNKEYLDLYIESNEFITIQSLRQK